MRLISITIIVCGHGTDKVLVKTNLPGPVYPFDIPLCLQFDVAHGKGLEYCKKNFPEIPVEDCFIYG